MEFKDLLKAKRLENNMTLEEVGRRVGVSKATVQRWESGEIKNIRRDKIAKLARALNVSPAYLMGWENDDGVADVGLATLEVRRQDGISLAEAEKRAEEIIRNGQNSYQQMTNKELDDKLISMLASLEQQDIEKVKAFVEGLKAARKE